ncbi:MAG: hypothetical protein ACR2JG_09405, partial [Geodermatophilaceae bacterium]
PAYAPVHAVTAPLMAAVTSTRRGAEAQGLWPLLLRPDHPDRDCSRPLRNPPGGRGMDLRCLAADRGVHVHGGQFYRWVVNGWVHFDDRDWLRDLARTRITGKVACGDYTVAQNDADVGTTPRSVGLWLDTSQQDPDETVAEILDRRSEARVR